MRVLPCLQTHAESVETAFSQDLQLVRNHCVRVAFYGYFGILFHKKDLSAFFQCISQCFSTKKSGSSPTHVNSAHTDFILFSALPGFHFTPQGIKIRHHFVLPARPGREITVPTFLYAEGEMKIQSYFSH